MKRSGAIVSLKGTPPWEWPTDAGDTLRAILEDGGAEGADRLIAADLAGEIVAMSDALAGTLLDILARDDEIEDLRAQAAISLGPVLELMDEDGFEDLEDVLVSEATFDAIRKALRAAYLNAAFPKLVRRRALEASVRAPDEWHVRAARAAWKSGDGEWRRTAVFCMEYVRGFKKEILAALDEGDADTRYHAVRAAGNWELKAAWPHVAAIVENERVDKALLLAAIEAVAGVDPVRAPDLLDPLLDSDDEEVADAVRDALAMAGDVSAMDDDGDDGGDDLFRR